MTGRRSITVQVLSEEDVPGVVRVDELLVRLHKVVVGARSDDPELDAYHLYDLNLRLSGGQLLAELEFRR
ncbi:hypothetical protein LLE49_00910 [Alicyclobacillus tolerans]|uniref:hypothetical protein n=1 Tax=Alicyclobacillus tolerans TaxID=90970 RepID=UPI001F19F061|nr:hypothetical protein [Alicyclobacillus tolerans]MCF8563304.1 hypothetical protein [Alicyclobacillus tolerans]